MKQNFMKKKKQNKRIKNLNNFKKNIKQKQVIRV